MLQHDPSLDWAPPAAVGADAATEARAEPARRAGGIAGRVPVPVSPLIGRSAELARLDELLERHRAVTLTGPAGAGKTRLGHRARRPGPPPRVLRRLQPDRRPEAGGADGGRGGGADSRSGQRPRRVRSRRRSWPRTCCSCSTPASTSSRRRPSSPPRSCGRRRACTCWPRAGDRLAISGELAWPVPPLDLPPPGRRRQRRRSPRTRRWRCSSSGPTPCDPTCDIDDAAAGDIAAVCLALDGLPLAIELAAARTDVLSPRPSAPACRTASSCSSTAASTSLERQQTLRAAIDWSFELLSADQRTFFARLGAFAGTFDLDAALDGRRGGAGRAAGAARVTGQAVDGGPRRLTTATACSTRCGPTRWTCSPTSTPTPPVTATPTSTSSWPSRARWRSVAPTSSAGSTGSAATSTTSAPASSGRLLTGNVDRAARLAGALAWFWTLNGMLTEAIQHLEGLIEVDDVPPASRAKCLWGYALLAASLGRLETARDAGYRRRRAGPRWRRTRHRGVRPQRRRRRRVGARQPRPLPTSPPARRSACSTSSTTAGGWPCATSCRRARCSTWVTPTLPGWPARASSTPGAPGTATCSASPSPRSPRSPSPTRTTERRRCRPPAKRWSCKRPIGYTEGIDLRAARARPRPPPGGGHRRGRVRTTAAPSASPRASGTPPPCARRSKTWPVTRPLERPDVAAALLRAARDERGRQGLPLRQRDAAELAKLEATVARRCGPAVDTAPSPISSSELSG